MKSAERSRIPSRVLAVLFILGCLPFLPETTDAQTPSTPAAGNNAVFGSSAACSPSGCIASTAFIDASVLTGSDLCAKINTALTSGYPATGAVIDARGIGSGTTQSCTSGTPWGSSTNPSTILLPAGTIQISTTWTLPDRTRLVGMGPGITTIQAQSNIGTIIAMGSTTSHGISVEDLTLDGDGFNLIGISNSNAQELSYVKHVNLYRVAGTGLSVAAGAQNSGPYSDIGFNAAGFTSSSTACVKLTTSTRGIHTMTCVSGATTLPTTAIYLGGSNNSIEDVKIGGFNNGIMVGENGVAQSNTLLNISGDGTVGTGSGTAVVRICGNGCPSHSTVTDLTLVGVATGGGSGNSIRDELVNTTLTDPTVGIYILGKSVTVAAATGYSRFTTSKNTATWGVGNIGSTAPTAADCTNTTGRNTTGSLFSNTSTTSGNTALYVCSGTAWVAVK